jgi:hypothetical protein
MNLREIGWYIVVWTRLAKERDEWQVLVNMFMSLGVP